MSTSKAWYIRHLADMEVKGPFPAGQISQEILLGRHKAEDEVSHDKEQWHKIRDVPDLLPNILNNDAEQPEFEDRLAAARRWADERRDITGKRATSKTDDVQRLHGLVNKAKRKSSFVSSCMQMGAVFGVVFALVVLAFQYSPEIKVEVDCSTAAKPGVDWRECVLVSIQLAETELKTANLMNTNLEQANMIGANLSQANLKYSKLNSANLQGANLTKANLKGASLVGADLSTALFNQADLSYATLRGAIIDGADFSAAILDGAIWVDGRTCAKDSIGQCK